MRKLLSDRRGASAVEFALISPFLLLLIAAVLGYGSLFATSLSLQQLAAETARATIGGLNDTERKTLAQTHLNALKSTYPMLNASKVSFAFDAGTSSTLSQITVSYDLATHPAYALKELLPLPKSPLTYKLVVTDGNGATS